MTGFGYVGVGTGIIIHVEAGVSVDGHLRVLVIRLISIDIL